MKREGDGRKVSKTSNKANSGGRAAVVVVCSSRADLELYSCTPQHDTLISSKLVALTCG